MIVVDASAALLGLLDNGDARAHLADDRLVCPHLIDAEIAHSLRSRVQRGETAASDAHRALTTWARFGVRRMGATGLLERVWELRDNLSAYDATYVALAEALDAPLLTADARIARAPGPTCPITVVRN